MIGPTCPTCRRVHATTDVIAVGRFRRPLTGYRVLSDPTGRLYATREEARAAACAEQAEEAS